MNEEQSTPAVQQGPLTTIWSQNAQGMKNIERSHINVRTKHGMFASVPIICRGRSCPYFETCWIPENDLQVGGRCPIEIATILDRFERYCEQLNIDAEEEIVDAGLVKDVVDIEIMMVRADGLLARDADLIEEVVAGVTPKGQEYYKPEIHPAVELKERLRKEKTRILNQLNATRKDKKDDGGVANDPSSVAARIIQKVRRLEKEGKMLDVSNEGEIVEAEIVEEVKSNDKSI